MMLLILLRTQLSHLAQHTKRRVETINVAVPMTANLSTQESSASCQIKNLNLVVKTKLQESLSTLIKLKMLNTVEKIQ